MVTDYSAERLEVIRNPPELRPPARGGVRWIRISGEPSLVVLDRLRETFGVDALVLEDIVTSGQRPKLNEIGDGLFLALMVPIGPPAAGTFQQLSVYLTGDTLISHTAEEGQLFAPLTERLEQPHSRLRQSDGRFLLYAILDLAVDHLFPELDELGERMEQLEAEILDNPTRTLLGEVHRLRSTMLILRRIAWATREVTGEMLRHLDAQESVRAYLQDAYDHIVTAIDLVETYRDMATSLIEVHLSVVSNRMNDVIRVLTIIATVFIPPTFVVGVYGMNFDRHAGPWSMPELGWPYGYLLIMGLIAMIMVTMLVYFRRKRWL